MIRNILIQLQKNIGSNLKYDGTTNLIISQSKTLGNNLVELEINWNKYKKTHHNQNWRIFWKIWGNRENSHRIVYSQQEVSNIITLK